MFIARAVAAGHALWADICIWEVQRLSQAAQALYQTVHAERLANFPPNTDKHHIAPQPAGRRQFAHQLRHDAESIFWLLVWWMMLARGPTGTSESSGRIHAGPWNNFIRQDAQARNPDIEENMLDPAYAESYPLLQALGKTLQYDLHWAKQSTYQKDDFLHESMQRILLNFIVQHRDSHFMNLKKHKLPRVGGGNSTVPHSYQSQTDSLRDLQG